MNFLALICQEKMPYFRCVSMIALFACCWSRQKDVTPALPSMPGEVLHDLPSRQEDVSPALPSDMPPFPLHYPAERGHPADASRLRARLRYHRSSASVSSSGVVRTSKFRSQARCTVELGPAEDTGDVRNVRTVSCVSLQNSLTRLKQLVSPVRS